MPKAKPPFAPEYRRQMVELVRPGRNSEELDAELGVLANFICNWVHQADIDVGRRQVGVTTEECQELMRLRRENRQLRIEREILSIAAALLARETRSMPARDSSL